LTAFDFEMQSLDLILRSQSAGLKNLGKPFNEESYSDQATPWTVESKSQLIEAITQ
jgi:hypothetical protein